MNSFYELHHPFWLSTPKGEARCWAIIDYGPNDDLVFCCQIMSGPHKNESWQFYNPAVRFLPNRTFGQ